MRVAELTLIVAMSFDLIVLVLTTIALMKSPSRSSLWQLLFRQGLIYFLVAFIANVIPAIFLVLDLNSTCFSCLFVCFFHVSELMSMGAALTQYDI